MKIQKCITIDNALAIELERKGKEINVSKICENALLIAVEFEKPKKEEDIKARLMKIESEKIALTKLLDKEKVAQKEIEAKTNKAEFREDLIKLRNIRKSNPNMFVVARKSLENKYNMTNAEIIKHLEKV